MEVTAYWQGGYRIRIPLRDFEVRADEPPQYGGSDAGPMPTELFLASLAACLAMAVAHAAKKREMVLPDLAVRVNGHYEGLGFDRIRIEVLSSHPKELLDEILEKAISTCYVSNTLRARPELEYAVVESPVTHEPPLRPR